MSEKAPSSPPPPYYPSLEGGLAQPQKTEGYPPEGGFQYPPPQAGGQTYPPQAPYPAGQTGQTYPPQATYPAGQVGQTTVLINTGNDVTRSPQPCQTFCPTCQENVVTQCEYISSSMTWIICAIIFCSGFLLIFPFFCCWIPFCMDSLSNVIHRCPKCKRTLGTHMRGAF